MRDHEESDAISAVDAMHGDPTSVLAILVRSARAGVQHASCFAYVDSWSSAVLMVVEQPGSPDRQPRGHAASRSVQLLDKYRRRYEWNKLLRRVAGVDRYW